jgi:beta-xylosidase
MQSTGRFTSALLLISLLAACKSDTPQNTIQPGLVATQVASTISAQVATPTALELKRSTEILDDTPPVPIETVAPTNASTSEPTPAPSQTPPVAFRDDFNTALEDGWSWLRENTQLWSLSANPGYLRITLNPGNCGSVARNIPLRPAPAGNYELATLIDFTPISDFQLAGLFIYQDDDNMLKFGRAFCSSAGQCVGNGVYFDSYINGAFTGSNFATSTTNPSRLYLRLQKADNVFRGFFSEDGENWTMIGQHTNDLISTGVGLFAGQSCEGSVPADFDYFMITNLP